MKRFLFIFVCPFLLLLNPVKAQYWLPAGGRSAAMGTASVSMNDLWSSHNNQAGMAFLKKPAIGLYYENRYLLKELSYKAAAAAIPTRYGTFGLNLGYSGDKLFSTLDAGLAYAMAFGSRFAAGIQLDMLQARLSESYGNRIMATFEAGIQARLSEQLSFGAHVFNPFQVKLEDYHDGRVPAIMNAGFSYTFSERLLWAAEVMKNTEFPLQFMTGAEYKFFDKGFVRLGMTTSPFIYTFGFGLALDKIHLDLSSSVHETLGYSPQASFYYVFK